MEAPPQASTPVVRLDLLGSLGLTGEDGRDVSAVLAQPKRLTLLAYLALAEPRGLQRRDLLVAMFWPDRPDAQARAALRRSLHFLRQHLGDRVIVGRGEDEVAVAADQLSCDALHFERRVQADRLEEALALYRGDFLTGVFVGDGSSDIDQWIERRRHRYCEDAFAAASTQSDREWTAGRIASARGWARRALDLSPLSEPAALRLLRLLDAVGERTAALQLYDDFTRVLRQELDVEPNAELHAFVETLRRTRSVITTAPKDSDRRVLAPLALPPTLPARRIEPSAPFLSGFRGHPVFWSTVAITATAALAGSRWLAVSHAGSAPPVLAVGELAVRGSSDSASIAASMPELLATGFAALRGVQVISRGRLYEVSTDLGDRPLSAAGLLRAARSAGANTVVEGEVYSQPTGLRLDLRLVDLRAGTVQRSYTVRAATPFDLADSAVGRLAVGLRRAKPAGRSVDLARTPLQARRYFDDGLRAYYRGALSTADALFRLAIAQDSTYAMALYFDARTRSALGSPRPEIAALAARAVRAARQSSGYEQLLIRTYWAGLDQDPAMLGLADSLLAAFPYEPEAYEQAGQAHWYAADYAGELRIYHRLAEIDAISIRDTSDECRACIAMMGVAEAYSAMDSLEKALPVMERLTRLRPRDRLAWRAQVTLLTSLGRRDEVVRLMGTPADRAGATADDILGQRTRAALRIGDFDQADRDVSGLLALAGEDLRDGLWEGIINDRVQGRLSAARAKAQRLDAITPPASRAVPDFLGGLSRGLTWVEGGSPRVAAAVFDSLRRLYPVRDTSGWRCRPTADLVAGPGDNGAGRGRGYGAYRAVRGHARAGRSPQQLCP